MLHSGQELHIWAELAGVLADEEAIHSAYANKGHAGWRPCLLCENVYLLRLTRDPADNDVPHTCTTFSALRKHTPATHQAVAQRLAESARVGPRARHEDLETELGWNYVANFVLWNPRWREIATPSKTVMYDFMHVYFVSGIFNVQVGHLLHHLKRHNITTTMLDGFVQLFHMPKASAKSAGQDLFSPKRVRASLKEWSLKATASEGLSIGPILDLYCFDLQRNTVPDLRKHATCFNLLWIVVTLMLTSTRPSGRCVIRKG